MGSRDTSRLSALFIKVPGQLAVCRCCITTSTGNFSLIFFSACEWKLTLKDRHANSAVFLFAKLARVCQLCQNKLQYHQAHNHILQWDMHGRKENSQICHQERSYHKSVMLLRLTLQKGQITMTGSFLHY